MKVQIYIYIYYKNNETTSVFGYRLFCWNWKFIAENTVDKDKN